MGFIGRYRSILRDRVNLYHRDLEPVAPGPRPCNDTVSLEFITRDPHRPAICHGDPARFGRPPNSQPPSRSGSAITRAIAANDSSLRPDCCSLSMILIVALHTVTSRSRIEQSVSGDSSRFLCRFKVCCIDEWYTSRWSLGFMGETSIVCDFGDRLDDDRVTGQNTR